MRILILIAALTAFVSAIPANIKLRPISRNSVSLSWQQEFDPNLKGFTVHYHNGDGRTTEWLTKVIWDPRASETVIDGLRSEGEYSFCVRSIMTGRVCACSDLVHINVATGAVTTDEDDKHEQQRREQQAAQQQQQQQQQQHGGQQTGGYQQGGYQQGGYYQGQGQQQGGPQQGGQQQGGYYQGGHGQQQGGYPGYHQPGQGGYQQGGQGGQAGHERSGQQGGQGGYQQGGYQQGGQGGQARHEHSGQQGGQGGYEHGSQAGHQQGGQAGQQHGAHQQGADVSTIQLLEAGAIGGDYVQLRWRYDGPKPAKFLITYRGSQHHDTAEGQGEEEQEVDAGSPVELDVEHYVAHGLRPDTTYTFEVVVIDPTTKRPLTRPQSIRVTTKAYIL